MSPLAGEYKQSSSHGYTWGSDSAFGCSVSSGSTTVVRGPSAVSVDQPDRVDLAGRRRLDGTRPT